MLSHLLQYVYMYVCVKAAVDVVLYRDLLILYDVHITGENVSWISIPYLSVLKPGSYTRRGSNIRRVVQQSE